MKRIGVILAFMHLTILLLNAQNLPYINYTTHNGLPQIQVQKLFQDSQGYIWVGTKGGLAKFNGERFEHFLYNEYIYGIGETLSKTMYFLTLDSVYKQERGKIKAVDAVKGRKFLVTGKDEFWIADNNEIKEYRQDTLYQTIKKDVDIFDEIIPDCVSYDKENQQLLFSTKNNHTVYALKDKKLNRIANFDVPIELCTFENGAVYYMLYLTDKEHIAINPITKDVYFRYVIVNNKLSFKEINDIPTKKHLLANYFNYTYFLIDSATQQSKKIDIPIQEEVYAFLIDRDNNYWLGTDNGLYQTNNKSFDVYPREFMNDFWTIIKGKDGKFYGGQFKGGLFELDFKNQKKREIKAKGKDNMIVRDYYYGSSMDNNGNLYFPSHYGMVKYDYKKAKYFDTGISLISKYDAYNQKIVFGQHCGIGLIDDKEQIKVYKDSTKSIVASHPSALEFKPNGDILIGNQSGIAIFNETDKKFISASSCYNFCPNQSVISMARDYKDNVWIGGKSQLWLYDSKKDSFLHIGKEFFNTGILSIISPDSTLLLIGTSYEIFAMRLDKFYNEQKVEFKMFNFRNGFFSEEVAQNGFLLDEDRVIIPSSTTTAILRYKDISFTSEHFNVWITKINEVGLSIEEQMCRKSFKAERGKNRLDIDFESVGFGLPTKIRFKYKLEGVDKDWSNWSEVNKVHYSGLRSGRYTFHVVAQNGDNLISLREQSACVDIIIALPFYKEPNFYQYVFFIFLVLTLIATYFIWRAYKNRLAVQSREKKIKLLEIATLQAQINPHFIFNFLSSIQSLISQKAPEKANEYLVKFSRLMRSYMEASIKSSKILTGSTIGNENTIKEEIDLLTTYIELEKLKYVEGKINYTVDLEDKSILNKTIPPMILQPFVENAIKHGIIPKQGAGRVTIRFYHEKETLVCVIADDGIGRELSAKINEQSIRAYKSRGMQLIKSRVEMLNKLDYTITIDFEDPENGGTIVTIKIQI